QLQHHHRAGKENRQNSQEVQKVRLGSREIGNPQERRLAKIDRDGDCGIERKKKRHLNQQRQTSAQRVRFLHQTQLLHLQLFHPGVALLHPFQRRLQLFHARRVFLGLLHLARRLPLEREEERINENGEENDRDAVTSGEALKF